MTRPRPADLLEPGTRRVRPIVWVGVALSVFQQLVGINVIFYYGEVLWEAAGATASDALRNNVLTGLTNIAATLAAIALIDRVGRRPLLLAGSLGMVVTLAVEAAAFGSGSVDAAGRLRLSEGAGWTGLIAANLYIVAFGVSWGPVVWVMLGEMFANRFRGAALAVAASAQWLANFLVTITFPPLLERLGLAGAYGLYTAASLLSFFFVLRFVPETRGKTLEQM
jgi:SP family sugar:H+ symporter-like MFS transporter